MHWHTFKSRWLKCVYSSSYFNLKTQLPPWVRLLTIDCIDSFIPMLRLTHFNNIYALHHTYKIEIVTRKYRTIPAYLGTYSLKHSKHSWTRLDIFLLTNHYLAYTIQLIEVFYYENLFYKINYTATLIHSHYILILHNIIST